MSEFDRRAEIVANLHAMATLFEQNPELPVPYSIYISTWVDDMETARSSRKGICGWKKVASPSRANTEYNLSIGGNEYGAGSITYSLSVPKTETCKRVQVDTRHIEAHDEPVYEWVCNESENEE